MISDKGLLTLPALPLLYKIDLNDTRTGTRESITSLALAHIANHCPNLRIAYFRRCINITDDGKVVAQLPLIAMVTHFSILSCGFSLVAVLCVFC